MSTEVEAYQDKQGKYWIWSEVSGSNLAVRCPDELTAYKEALHQASFILSLYKERRDKAEASLELLQQAFEKVFPND